MSFVLRFLFLLILICLIQISVKSWDRSNRNMSRRMMAVTAQSKPTYSLYSAFGWYTVVNVDSRGNAITDQPIRSIPLRTAGPTPAYNAFEWHLDKNTNKGRFNITFNPTPAHTPGTSGPTSKSKPYRAFGWKRQENIEATPGKIVIIKTAPGISEAMFEQTVGPTPRPTSELTYRSILTKKTVAKIQQDSTPPIWIGPWRPWFGEDKMKAAGFVQGFMETPGSESREYRV